MTPTNCWNLRVTAEVNQGGRKYMEDVTSVQFERVKSGKVVVEYAAFAIYDGHGGKDAAHFARDHLLENIKVQKGFFSNNEESVKKAISDAFVITHHAMWNKLHEWPKTPMGHPSTAGTTASLVIIRGNRVYVANVGDSMIVMGSRDIQEKPNQPSLPFIASGLTIDHKPGLLKERKRIEKCGGCVMNKSGVNRVVWSRPKLNHTGPIRRSTKIDKIPFLAVARSLGDLWSFNSELNEFVVSPIPDVYVYDLYQNKEQFIVLASDGLWNMVRPQECVSLVGTMEDQRKDCETPDSPAHKLVQMALQRWSYRQMRADNTSVIVVVIERRRIEPAKRKETYFESWTSATAEGGAASTASSKGDSKKEDKNQKLKLFQEETTKSPDPIPAAELLQDASISSSNGDVSDRLVPKPKIEPTSNSIAPNKQPTGSGLPDRLTRSRTGGDSPNGGGVKRRTSGASASSSPRAKSRRMSLRSGRRKRPRSEGGSRPTPITARRLRRSKRSL